MVIRRGVVLVARRPLFLYYSKRLYFVHRFIKHFIKRCLYNHLTPLIASFVGDSMRSFFLQKGQAERSISCRGGYFCPGRSRSGPADAGAWTVPPGGLRFHQLALPFESGARRRRGCCFFALFCYSRHSWPGRYDDKKLSRNLWLIGFCRSIFLIKNRAAG